MINDLHVQTFTISLPKQNTAVAVRRIPHGVWNSRLKVIVEFESGRVEREVRSGLVYGGYSVNYVMGQWWEEVWYWM